MASNPTDWLSQSYHADFFNTAQTDPPPAAVSAASRNTINLSPDQGRVAKPIRRRSRPSRRTPTTMLNTDTSNFRAMVQRFTGGPAAALSAGGGGTLNFTEHMTGGGGGGFHNHVQYENQELQQQHMMFLMGGRGGGGAAAQPPPMSVSGNENYLL